MVEEGSKDIRWNLRSFLFDFRVRQALEPDYSFRGRRVSGLERGGCFNLKMREKDAGTAEGEKGREFE